MNRGRGATLVELVVAMALVALLAGFALPGFRAQVLRTNRTEARGALLALASAEEKFHLDCGTYASTVDAASPSSCSPPSLRFSPTTERGHYALAVSAADASTWTATATAAAGGVQIADAPCRVFRLTAEGLRSATDSSGASSTRTCWER
jgi:type IV pilus assembly protein PilE